MDAQTSPRLLDVTEAARRLQVHPDTIRRRIRSGDLPAFRVAPNGNVRIPVSAVDKLLVPYERRPA